MFTQRGVFGHSCGNSSFVPSLGILTTNFALNCSFVIPRKGYFIKFELFLSPKGWEFNQKMCTKVKCLTYTLLSTPLPPSNEKKSGYEHVEVLGRQLNWLCSDLSFKKKK